MTRGHPASPVHWLQARSGARKINIVPYSSLFQVNTKHIHDLQPPEVTFCPPTSALWGASASSVIPLALLTLCGCDVVFPRCAQSTDPPGVSMLINTTQQTCCNTNMQCTFQSAVCNSTKLFYQNKKQQEVKAIWQKAPHGGPILRLGVTPGGRNLYHWIPVVWVPIGVP